MLEHISYGILVMAYIVMADRRLCRQSMLEPTNGHPVCLAFAHAREIMHARACARACVRAYVRHSLCCCRACRHACMRTVLVDSTCKDVCADVGMDMSTDICMDMRATRHNFFCRRPT